MGEGGIFSYPFTHWVKVFFPNKRLVGRIFSPYTYSNGVNTHRLSGRGYPLPSLAMRTV
jgi:hypothetical protein